MMCTSIGNYLTTRRHIPVYWNVKYVVSRFLTLWINPLPIVTKSRTFVTAFGTQLKHDGFLEYVEQVQLAASQWWPCFLWNHVQSSEYLLASWTYSPFCVKNRLRILLASGIATSTKWNFPFNSVGFWRWYSTWLTEVIFLWAVSYSYGVALRFRKRHCFRLQVKEST